MFSSVGLLPIKSKPTGELKPAITMTREEMTSETEIVKRCQREQFYQLVRNEPSKYLYLVEKWPDCHDYVAKEFSFLVEREKFPDKDGDLVKVEVSVKSEHPVVFTSENGESELADDVSLYITAKLNERSGEEMGRRLPRRKQEVSKNAKGNETTRESDNGNLLSMSSSSKVMSSTGQGQIRKMSIDNREIVERLDRIERMLSQLVEMQTSPSSNN